MRNKLTKLKIGVIECSINTRLKREGLISENGREKIPIKSKPNRNDIGREKHKLLNRRISNRVKRNDRVDITNRRD